MVTGSEKWEVKSGGVNARFKFRVRGMLGIDLGLGPGLRIDWG